MKKLGFHWWDFHEILHLSKKVTVKQSRYRPGVAQRVPES
jgi:hypothetical protein